MANFQIRDARDNDRYFLDNELIDVYGKKIGAFGVAVYNVLARYANYNSQECFPSYKTIAEALDISRNSVITAIKKLEENGLISTEKRISTEKGKPTTTSIYTLLAVKKTRTPSTSEVLGSNPSPCEVPGVVLHKNHPGAPEVPEQNVFNKTNSKKGGIAPRPPKSEAVLIEEYFLKETTGSIGCLSPMQRELITDLVAKGYTLERCKPGIDQTIAEMNAKGKSVGSFKMCIASIVQLDPTKIKPIPINSRQAFYEKPAPFEQPKRVFNEDDYKLTPAQIERNRRKLEEDLAWEAADRAAREAAKLQKVQLQA